MLFREAVSTPKTRPQIANLRQRRRTRTRWRASRRPLSRTRSRPMCGQKGVGQFSPKEDRFYRVSAELRSAVVFTALDVLADPPFARLDFMKCRNLFDLPSAGGASQGHLHHPLRVAPKAAFCWSATPRRSGQTDGRFGAISKPQRVPRPRRRASTGRFGTPLSAGDGPPLARASRPSGRSFAPDRACRALPTDGAGGLWSGCGSDQPQTRMYSLCSGPVDGSCRGLVLGPSGR